MSPPESRPQSRQVLSIECTREMDATTLAVRGTLSRATVPMLERALTNALAELGRVVVDTRELHVDWAPALRTFPGALSRAGGWPTARLTLFGATGELVALLERLRIPASVPVADDAPTAHALLHARPQCITRQHRLARHPGAPGESRALIAAACTDWQLEHLDELREDASLIASELVANAVEHALTGCRLRVTLDERGLTVAVRDYRRTTLPRQHAVDPTARRGRGLQVIAALAETWSATPHRDGKTVWARLPACPPS